MCGILRWLGRYKLEGVGLFGNALDRFAYRGLMTATTEHHFYKHASTQAWLKECFEGGSGVV